MKLKERLLSALIVGCMIFAMWIAYNAGIKDCICVDKPEFTFNGEKVDIG